MYIMNEWRDLSSVRSKVTMSVKPEDSDPPPPQYEPPQHPAQSGLPMPQAPQPQSIHQQQQQNTTNVVVVNNQPSLDNRLILGSVYGHRDWTTGLCGCTEDLESCLKTWFCTECVIMEISAKLNENICVTSFVPGSLVTLRTRLRTLGGIEGSICKDYCVLCCFPLCAICQMERELKAMSL